LESALFSFIFFLFPQCDPPIRSHCEPPQTIFLTFQVSNGELLKRFFICFSFVYAYVPGFFSPSPPPDPLNMPPLDDAASHAPTSPHDDSLRPWFFSSSGVTIVELSGAILIYKFDRDSDIFPLSEDSDVLFPMISLFLSFHPVACHLSPPLTNASYSVLATSYCLLFLTPIVGHTTWIFHSIWYSLHGHDGVRPPSKSVMTGVVDTRESLLNCRTFTFHKRFNFSVVSFPPPRYLPAKPLFSYFCQPCPRRSLLGSECHPLWPYFCSSF